MNAEDLANSILEYMWGQCYTQEELEYMRDSLLKVWQQACFAQQHNAYLDINFTTNSRKIKFTLPPFKIDSL